MIIFEEGYIDQFMGHDYAMVSDNGNPVLVMLPHGDANGNMYDRAGKVVISEDKLLDLAINVIRPVLAQKHGFEAEECPIVAAPCYPNAVRAKVNRLEILGDWNTTTCCHVDVIGRVSIASC